MEKVISVIVPIYNTAVYLERCVKSIQNQIMADLEIILVDDGSTDASKEICDKYAKEDSRIRVIHKQNGGSASARYEGIKAAAGKYIAFVDSDDWLEEDMYWTLYKKAEEQEADVVAEGIKEDFLDDTREKRNWMPEGVYGSDKARAFFRDNMINCENYFCSGVQPYLCNKLFRKELLVEHLSKIDPRIKVGEDAAVLYPILTSAKRIVISSECHYHYCIRQDSMMTNYYGMEDEYINIKLLNRTLREAFRKQGILPHMEGQLLRYTANNMLTRAYGKWGDISAGQVFPFGEVDRKSQLIIYGAGAFGRAVYTYISQDKLWEIKAWIDADAVKYQKMHMPVQSLEETDIEETDTVLLSLLNINAKKFVEENLIAHGVNRSRILWIEDMDRYMKEVYYSEFCGDFKDNEWAGH